ncbi:MAG: hypothetical protein RIT25_1113, partial [Planctomycetota bacterium]
MIAPSGLLLVALALAGAARAQEPDDARQALQDKT